MTDDLQTPPPGLTRIDVNFDGFAFNFRGTVRIDGHNPVEIVVALRPHHDGSHLDAMIGNVNDEWLPDISVIAPFIERYVADVTGTLVDWTTDPDWHIDFLDPTEPAPDEPQPDVVWMRRGKGPVH